MQAALPYLEAKIATTHGGLVSRAAHAAVLTAVRRFASAARGMGFSPTELPDVSEATQSVPRGDGAPICTRLRSERAGVRVIPR